jgi:SAM-dependent methyltransferase
MTPAFDLDRAVPWGRNRVEYLAFFDLLGLDPEARVLDCGGGPSSFAAEMAALGHRVVAADPLYRWSRGEIAQRIAAARAVVKAGLQASVGRFVWSEYGSPEGLEATRLSAMKFFLEDLERLEDGRDAGSYVAAALPDLPFGNGAFELALSSHLLFTYSAQLDFGFHLAAVQEMLRVAHEARIFPLLDLDGRRSSHLTPLCEALAARGFACQIRAVGYEFQKGGNEMLRVIGA